MINIRETFISTSKIVDVGLELDIPDHLRMSVLHLVWLNHSSSFSRYLLIGNVSVLLIPSLWILPRNGLQPVSGVSFEVISIIVYDEVNHFILLVFQICTRIKIWWANSEFGNRVFRAIPVLLHVSFQWRWGSCLGILGFLPVFRLLFPLRSLLGRLIRSLQYRDLLYADVFVDDTEWL